MEVTNMKKIHSTILAAAVLLMTSCEILDFGPHFIETTADRQGLTSLTAIFTFGPYVDQELAKLVIEDDAVDRFVIPVPWYFPDNTDDQTLIYLTKVRVQAELQPNYKLSPGLGVLDLTEENEFTYTDPHGNSRKIIITGERVKSSANDITSFVITSPLSVSGVIDREHRTITLPTRDDVSACKATVSLSPHATITPDPAKAHNYTDGFKYTVISDNGTEAEWLVQTGDPEKLETGLDINSIDHLFALDPVSRMGLPAYTAEVAPSLACVEDNLVVCLGDGSTPVVYSGLDGSRLREIVLTGDAVPGSITSDEAGHMLITNIAQGGDNRETVKVFCTSSTRTAPELLFSFDNPLSTPIGHKMKVIGDVTGKAAVVFTGEGIAGVTSSGEIVVVSIEGGVASEPVVYDFYSNNGFAWGAAPVNIATVVAASTDFGNDGFYLDYYEGGTQELDMLHWVTASYKDTPIQSFGNGAEWALNANCLDTKGFNNCRYMAVFVVSHFPQWGMGPQLYLYDITDPSSPSLLVGNDGLAWYQQGAAGIAAGDVLLAPSSDGFYLTVFYYDHNSASVGAYRVDCIKRQ